MTELKDRLFSVRRHLGLNQEEIATKVGRSSKGWQTYEHGKNLPGGEVFLFLYELGVNIHWLISGEGEMMRNGNTSDDADKIPTKYGLINDLLEDEDIKEFLEMPTDLFFELFYDYGRINKAMLGWMHIEMLKRFPEFKKWLKKQREKSLKDQSILGEKQLK